MPRPAEEICEDIADMSAAERGDLIRRIRGYDWPEERKAGLIQFIMLLSLVGERMPKAGIKRFEN